MLKRTGDNNIIAKRKSNSGLKTEQIKHAAKTTRREKRGEKT